MYYIFDAEGYLIQKTRAWEDLRKLCASDRYVFDSSDAEMSWGIPSLKYQSMLTWEFKFNDSIEAIPAHIRALTLLL